jgi:hypothetical protein
VAYGKCLSQIKNKVTSTVTLTLKRGDEDLAAGMVGQCKFAVCIWNEAKNVADKATDKTKYKFGGPNSNSYIGTILRKCRDVATYDIDKKFATSKAVGFTTDFEPEDK